MINFEVINYNHLCEHKHVDVLKQTFQAKLFFTKMRSIKPYYEILHATMSADLLPGDDSVTYILHIGYCVSVILALQ